MPLFSNKNFSSIFVVDSILYAVVDNGTYTSVNRICSLDNVEWENEEIFSIDREYSEDIVFSKGYLFVVSPGRQNLHAYSVPNGQVIELNHCGNSGWRNSPTYKEWSSYDFRKLKPYDDGISYFYSSTVWDDDQYECGYPEDIFRETIFKKYHDDVIYGCRPQSNVLYHCQKTFKFIAIKDGIVYSDVNKKIEIFHRSTKLCEEELMKNLIYTIVDPQTNVAYFLFIRNGKTLMYWIDTNEPDRHANRFIDLGEFVDPTIQISSSKLLVYSSASGKLIINDLIPRS